jgi:hypothetical protein
MVVNSLTGVEQRLQEIDAGLARMPQAPEVVATRARILDLLARVAGEITAATLDALDDLPDPDAPEERTWWWEGGGANVG